MDNIVRTMQNMNILYVKIVSIIVTVVSLVGLVVWVNDVREGVGCTEKSSSEKVETNNYSHFDYENSEHVYSSKYEIYENDIMGRKYGCDPKTQTWYRITRDSGNVTIIFSKETKREKEPNLGKCYKVIDGDPKNKIRWTSPVTCDKNNEHVYRIKKFINLYPDEYFQHITSYQEEAARICEMTGVLYRYGDLGAACLERL